MKNIDDMINWYNINKGMALRLYECMEEKKSETPLIL